MFISCMHWHIDAHIIIHWFDSFYPYLLVCSGREQWMLLLQYMVLPLGGFGSIRGASCHELSDSEKSHQLFDFASILVWVDEEELYRELFHDDDEW